MIAFQKIPNLGFFPIAVIALLPCNFLALPCHAQIIRLADTSGEIHEIADPSIDYTQYLSYGSTAVELIQSDHEGDGIRIRNHGVLRWEDIERMVITDKPTSTLKTETWAHIKKTGLDNTVTLQWHLPEDGRNKLYGRHKHGGFSIRLTRISGIQYVADVSIPPLNSQPVSGVKVENIEGESKTVKTVWFDYSDYSRVMKSNMGIMGSYQPNKLSNALVASIGDAELMIGLDTVKFVEFSPVKKLWVKKGGKIEFYDPSQERAWEMDAEHWKKRGQVSPRKVRFLWHNEPPVSPYYGGFGECLVSVYGRFQFLNEETASYQLRAESLAPTIKSRTIFPPSLESFRRMEIQRP